MTRRPPSAAPDRAAARPAGRTPRHRAPDRPAAGRAAAPTMPRPRLLLLAGGGVGLLLGTWTGLSRAGVHDPIAPMAAHGILMVLGFLGTLIALERAVAFGARWAFAGPALSALAVLTIAADLPDAVAGVLLTAAGLVVTAVYATTLARRVEPHLALMAAGAVAWVVAAALWAVGWSPVALAPTLAAFLVLTIVGERLELSRLRVSSAASRRRLLAAAALFGSGVALTLIQRPAGLVAAGVGLVAQTAWLARHDIARVTIHRAGLPRFAAACMLAGYLWLAVGGVLWIVLGAGVGGLVHDAALHAVFLGFVISMVMGHAPIILPAVLRTPLPYRPSAWVPLVLLHASVALRVAADLADSVWLRGWAAHGNVTALLLFAALAVVTARRAGRSYQADAPQPVRPAAPAPREQRSLT